MHESNRYWTTAVSDVEDNTVYIRGYNLSDLIGNLSFAAATFLLIRGTLPTPEQTRMMDGVLCSVLDYALKKTGYGAAASFEEAADALAADMRVRKVRIPGLGHPAFRHIDPRAQGLKELAQATGNWGELCDWYEALHRAFTTQAGKPEMVITEVGMLGAILAQMGFTPAEMTGLAVISTLPGVVAHVSEEMQGKVRIRTIADEHVTYARTRRNFAEDFAASLPKLAA